MNKIIINEISETTYDNDTNWISYKCDNSVGYEIIDIFFQGEEEKLQVICNSIEKINNKYSNKQHISVCSRYLQEIIINCLQSENEMFFVEYGDLTKVEILGNKDDFLSELKKEVTDLEIDNLITFGEDDCIISVYGEIITRFLF